MENHEKNVDLAGRSEYLRRMTKYFSVQCPPICETALFCLKVPRLRPIFFFNTSSNTTEMSRAL